MGRLLLAVFLTASLVCTRAKDPACPPDCSKDFCTANPKSECNIPGPREIPGCTGQCQLTYCNACYYSKTARDLPGNCRDCGSPISSLHCLKRWAKCIHVADVKENGKPSTSDITQENFKCYRYPCALKG
ncbi:hypothetical protein EMCRGX_G031647 [Ephydatia muelleri]